MSNNFKLGVFTTIIGVIYFIMAIRIPLAPMGDPMGPKYFPIGLGATMSISGVAMLFIGYFERKAASNESNTHNNKNYILIIIAVVISLAYAALFYKLGFLIATMLFLGSLMFVINGKQAWLTNIIITVIFTVGIQLVFERIFLIALP